MNTIADLHERIINIMQALVKGAVNSRGEERAFNAEEQRKFDALEAAARALKPVAESEPDVNKLLKAAFEKR